jgi:hypothetical protein
MNDIDEFFEVALGILFGISLLLILLTYLEKSLVAPVKEKARSNSDDSHGRDESRRTSLHRRSRS